MINTGYGQEEDGRMEGHSNSDILIRLLKELEKDIPKKDRKKWYKELDEIIIRVAD